MTEFGRPVNVNSLVYNHLKPHLEDSRTAEHTTLRSAAHSSNLGADGRCFTQVSEQLGHTSAAFTLDVYSHVLPHMQDDSAAKVEAELFGNND